MKKDVEEVKKIILKFWKTHPDFDDRSLKHVLEAEELLDYLYLNYSRGVIAKAISDLQIEVEKELDAARKKLYRLIERDVDE